MPQTILAVLALMMATTFALQQQRSILHTRAKLIRNEIAVQSTGVAETVLSEIGTRAFDQATAGDSSLTSPSQLTPMPFTGSSVRMAIEDYDGQLLQRKRIFRGDTLHFNVHIEIFYVQDDQVTPATGQTKNKRAALTVYSTDITRPDTVHMSRAYTCYTKCAWS